MNETWKDSARLDSLACFKEETWARTSIGFVIQIGSWVAMESEQVDEPNHQPESDNNRGLVWPESPEWCQPFDLTGRADWNHLRLNRRLNLIIASSSWITHPAKFEMRSIRLLFWWPNYLNHQAFIFKMLQRKKYKRCPESTRRIEIKELSPLDWIASTTDRD